MKLTSNFKKPGKLKHNFEDKDRQRKEKEKKKIEMEKKMKLSAELRAVKEYYFTHKEVRELKYAVAEFKVFLSRLYYKKLSFNPVLFQLMVQV